MSVWLSATTAAVALMAMSATSTVAVGEVLKICLDENLPPLSAHRRGAPDNGFDFALAREVAQRLGRPLEVQWFGSKLDEDSSPALETNALLSDGRCSLVGSYALTRDSLVVPGIKTAKLPDFEGATGPDHRRRVPLGVESGTLADAILMTFDNGRLIDDITHLVPGRSDLLGTLERGELDATLLDLRRFDAYRAAHPDTRLAGSGYFYPIGVNRGYVGLASDPALLVEVNKALVDLQATGAVTKLAEAAGLTFLPPHEPKILDDAMMKALRKP
jgi:ABC-type amino acid transport substrate-binding protein